MSNMEYVDYSRLISVLLDMDMPDRIIQRAISAQIALLEGDMAVHSTHRAYLIEHLWEWVRSDLGGRA